MSSQGVKVSWDVQLPRDVLNAFFQVKYALISAQRCMICQGDICRYREQANDTANYGKARRYCVLHPRAEQSSSSYLVTRDASHFMLKLASGQRGLFTPPYCIAVLCNLKV